MTTTNGNGNLVEEFEEAFQSCINVLTKDDALQHMDKEEIRAEVDQTISRVLDLARQTEAFFLQKRFLLSALKPEMIVNEDVTDLKNELARKEELIKRHYEKLNTWQNLISDLRQTQGHGTSSGPGMQPPVPPPLGQPNGVPHGPGGVPGPQGNMQLLQQPQHQMQQQQQMQIQMQQQQQQMQMQQQQMQMQQQVPNMGGNMSQQAMFMGGPSRGSPFAGGGVLQGPLAYLEKTTSNIGMADGRR